ncbi:uncharacterized protein BDR25DRAFT_359853 [Lindgomyces ingoldianus]|uniref:Uncharacterized protein n=1 Tax=Lindgomyces ingoldianus TaxID=673940 RepID=A0ACB6QGF1_9PLEO|nr:uncharacterized protein BDR25DRAFT_359853 [Lindgomyces ingoldianus]KAF2466063.1 hypothetical protein BDR25DRAFT_359853 [Lindgomyces ingoldianus]
MRFAVNWTDRPFIREGGYLNSRSSESRNTDLVQSTEELPTYTRLGCSFNLNPRAMPLRHLFQCLLETLLLEIGLPRLGCCHPQISWDFAPMLLPRHSQARYVSGSETLAEGFSSRHRRKSYRILLTFTISSYIKSPQENPAAVSSLFLYCLIASF